MNTPPLEELLAMAKERYDSMSPDQKDRMQQKQCESWARGEKGIGNDADEAREKRAAARRYDIENGLG